MWTTKTRSRRNRMGTARIQRATYATHSGFQQKNSWWDLRKAAIDRCNNICEHPGCKSPAKEVHHIIALSRGGTNTLSNLICLCKFHHDLRHPHLFKARR